MITGVRRFVFILWVASVCLLASPSTSAQERLRDPSWEFCYDQIRQLVQSETVGIDMAFYMIELPGLVDDLIARHKAGVAVRLVVEPRGSIKFPQNQPDRKSVVEGER